MLRLELRESRALAATLAVLHGGAAACVAISWPGLGGSVLAAAFVAGGAWAAWSVALLRRPASVRAIELGEEHAAVLELADGRRLQSRIALRRNVNRWWVTLPVRGARRTILVARGMLAPEDFRRLRLWALWGRVPAPHPEAAGRPNYLN
ncbi:MAG: protein YgfX [Burkholderiales bacterium]